MSATDEFDWEALRAAAEAAALRQGAPVHEAEDIAGETMERLVRLRNTVRAPLPFVRRVAQNLAIDLHRAAPPGRRATMPTSSPAPGKEGWPEHLRVSGVSGDVARRDLLERVLDVLNYVERDLLLGQAAGLTARELAERHGYAEGSVRVKLSSARRKIREAFPDVPELGFD